METPNENQAPVTPAPNFRQASSTLTSDSHRTFQNLDDNELSVLAALAINTLKERGLQHLLPISQHQPKPPDMFDNAKIEQIICSGIHPRYDGAPSSLLPTLNLIHIRRKNEVWYPATIIMQDNETIDMVQHFSKIKESTILSQAKTLWDAPDSHQQSHTRGTPTYYARLFGVFLMNSLTNDFALLLHSRIDQKYSADGPTLLYTMCSHIHRNHLAFVESIKTNIRSSSLASFNNDVPAFLRFLSDNLKLISSAGPTDKQHNDLIPHIFLQLRSTTIPVFQQTILLWQREYFNNKKPDLTPSVLVHEANEECQILKHAQQWVETIDPSVTAMQAMLKSTKTNSAQVFQEIAANFSEFNRRQRDINNDFRNAQRQQYNNYNNNPEWIFDPPTNLNKVRNFNGRAWHYCSKCGRNGRWVCTHTDSTHRSSTTDNRRSLHRDHHNDDRRNHRHYGYGRPPSPRSRSPDRGRYNAHSPPGHYQSNRLQNHWEERSRSRSPLASRSTSPSHHSRNVQFRPPTPKQPSAQISLLDSISNFLGTD
jgi:hypothetical protein